MLSRASLLALAKSIHDNRVIRKYKEGNTIRKQFLQKMIQKLIAHKKYM